MDLNLRQFCKLHSNLEVEYIHIHSEKSQMLKCSKCIIKERLNPKDLVLFDQCIHLSQRNHNDEVDDSFIENWPPGVNPILLNLIKNNLNVNKKDEVKKNILEYFELLEKELNENLQTTKKTILLQIESIDLNYNWAKEAYNQISQKDELSAIFSQNRDNPEELNSKLSDLIVSMKDKSQDYINTIKKLYQEFIERDSYVDFQQPNLIKKLMIELFQNIRFYHQCNEEKDENDQEEIHENNQEISEEENQKSELSCKPVIDYLNGLYYHFRKQKQTLESNFLEYDEKIVKLNNGINQFMTQAFLNKQYQSSIVTIQDLCKNLDQQLIQKDIKYYKLNDIFLDLNAIQESVINTSLSMLNIKEEQIQNLNLLIDSMKSNNKNPNYQNNTIEYFKNLLQADRSFVQKDLQSILDILEKYPIFDILPLKWFKPIKNNFVLSSTQGQIIDQNQKQTFISNSYEACIYAGNILDNSKKYIIRFKLSSSLNKINQIYIALIDTTTNLQYFISNFQQQGIVVSKGQMLHQKNRINEIEMRICIKDNLLIYSDFPVYGNLNTKTQNDPQFNLTNKYLIQIELHQAVDQFVQITGFYEVDEFPKFF